MFDFRQADYLLGLSIICWCIYHGKKLQIQNNLRQMPIDIDFVITNLHLMMIISFSNHPFCVEWVLEHVDGAKMLGLKKTHHGVEPAAINSQWKKPKKRNWNITFKLTLQRLNWRGTFWSLFVFTYLEDTLIQWLQDLQFVFPAKQTHGPPSAFCFHNWTLHWVIPFYRLVMRTR